MADETKPEGSIVIDTPEGIAAYRLLALRGMLKLACVGIRMSRGVSAYAQIKKEFKLSGNKAKVLALYEAKLKEMGVLK